MGKTILMATLVLLGGAVALTAWGDTEVVDGIEWTYTVSGDTATVVGNGSRLSAVSESTAGAITIPSTLGGKPVTSIGMWAFASCNGLTCVAIPSSVTYIENTAFAACSGLMQILVNSDNANYKSVNGSLLTKDGLTLVAGANSNMAIPDGVTRIGASAFHSRSGLTSVKIPAGVTNIGHGAFYACKNLISVIIPEGVTKIDGYTFCDCTRLKSVTIPSSVTEIESYAFGYCDGLKNVTFMGAPISSHYLTISELNKSSCNYSYPKQYGVAWSKLTGGLERFAGYARECPLATVVVSSIRANDPTILDVVYKVTSKKPTVKVRVLAFEDGERSFAKVVRPETFVEGTEANVGDNVTPNVEHTISWRVSSDWTTKLAKVKFEVLVCEGELLPLELMTIPASDQYGKMKVSWNRISGCTLFDAILWLYADHDPELTLSDGTLKWNDIVVAWNSRIEGRYIGGGGGYDYTDVYTYVFGKMGYLFANYNILSYVNQETRLGLSMSYGGYPDGARYYAYKIVEE